MKVTKGRELILETIDAEMARLGGARKARPSKAKAPAKRELKLCHEILMVLSHRPDLWKEMLEDNDFRALCARVASARTDPFWQSNGFEAAEQITEHLEELAALGGAP